MEENIDFLLKTLLLDQVASEIPLRYTDISIHSGYPEICHTEIRMTLYVPCHLCDVPKYIDVKTLRSRVNKLLNDIENQVMMNNI